MNKNTFGSVEKFKVLELLINNIQNLDGKYKEYISSFVNDFNRTVKKTKNINNEKFKIYVLDLIYNDYISKIDKNIKNKYDKKTESYLKNFIYAKIKNIKNKK